MGVEEQTESEAHHGDEAQNQFRGSQEPGVGDAETTESCKGSDHEDSWPDPRLGGWARLCRVPLLGLSTVCHRTARQVHLGGFPRAERKWDGVARGVGVSQGTLML